MVGSSRGNVAERFTPPPSLPPSFATDNGTLQSGPNFNNVLAIIDYFGWARYFSGKLSLRVCGPVVSSVERRALFIAGSVA